jgi:hypothetical protein
MSDCHGRGAGALKEAFQTHFTRIWWLNCINDLVGLPRVFFIVVLGRSICVVYKCSYDIS